jgi:membrane-bound lytic murein transglycosylase F
MKLSTFQNRFSQRIIALMIATAVGLTLTGCAETPSTLQQVKSQGELVIVTRNGPTTYYEGPFGATGPEYDLANLFAEHLGVTLKVKTATSLNEIIPMIAEREAHFAAAGLTITEERRKRIRFSSAYQTISQQVVYRASDTRPKSLHDITDHSVEVIAGSSHAAHLQKISMEYPALNWSETNEIGSDELLSKVWNKESRYAIADSNDVQMNQRFYPELRVAFDLTGPQQLAWAFPLGDDHSLYLEAQQFFQMIKKNGQLDQIMERHYGHIQDFDYVGTRTFMRHINKRLPRYIDYFHEASEQNNMDWRLLAAVGYQESHWNSRAVSPTGVRGIMMLTRATAADMGYDNRVKPRNSIMGGGRYLAQLKKRLPKRIQDPDRTWFALAAYNIGMGHLHDARIITQKRGGNPDKWIDVKDNLPLLMQKRWYKNTKYGYARGNEALQYVENIRSYYDILVWRAENGKIDPPLKVTQAQQVQHTIFDRGLAVVPAVM